MGGDSLHRVFLADTDKENIRKFTCLLEDAHNIRPAVWQNRYSFDSFIEAPEAGAVFIRIDDPFIPGLELTRYASDHYPRINIVWMAKSESYALEAFPSGVDSYLLLPLTAEKLEFVEELLEIAEVR
jgi:two-component SAPR family response regulator